MRQRWIVAKEKHLCFRCLSDRHLGPTRVCGLNGCKSNHHRLLHEVVEKDQQKEDIQNHPNQDSQLPTGRTLKTVPDEKAEGGSSVDQQNNKDKKTYTTSLASPKLTKDVFSLRTVPVWLKANGQKIRVNAILDDTVAQKCNTEY